MVEAWSRLICEGRRNAGDETRQNIEQELDKVWCAVENRRHMWETKMHMPDNTSQMGRGKIAGSLIDKLLSKEIG